MNMMISKLNYSQNIGQPDEWRLKDVNLGKLNLIVGRNAVGKTRALNVISSFARMISGKAPKLLDGHFEVSFREGVTSRGYSLTIEGNKVVTERLTERGRTLLDRTGDLGKIVHLIDGQEETRTFYPPEDKLTYQVRRDLRELPYLEKMATWADKYRIVRYSNIRPNELAIYPTLEPLTEDRLFGENLVGTAYLLERIQQDKNMKEAILDDLVKIGYRAKRLDVVSASMAGTPGPVKLIQVKEDGVPFYIPQTFLSEGIYRTISIVVVINYLLAVGAGGTIAIDDVGGGLDFERSARLTKMLFSKAKKSDVQLIATSNDRFLMNTVDLRYWNVLERKGTTVRSFNYRNSKRMFDRFMRLGLNNFDFFASELYKERTNE